MTAPIHVEPSYRPRRAEMRAAVHRALPHRTSYLGFTLGLIATVVVVLTVFSWWLVQSGKVQVWWYLQSGVLELQLRW